MGTATVYGIQLGEPNRIVSVEYTEAEIQCIMSWSNFLEDSNNPSSYVGTVGNIDNLILQMEFNFDQGTFTGSLSGSTELESGSIKSQHRFQGDISGGIEQAHWRSYDWFWEFEGEASLTLTYHLEHQCYSEEKGSFWDTREETIQVTANVAGSTFGGEGGIGNLNVQWNDMGGYNQGPRRFDLKGRNILENGGTDLPAEIPDPIDFNASLILPDSVNLASQYAIFRFEPNGRDVDMIDKVVWHFYHWDPEQDKYRWFTSFETQGTGNLEIEASVREEWKKLAETFGESLGDSKELWMKLEAWFYASEGRDLISPLSIEFSYEATTSPTSSDPQVNVPSSNDPESDGLPFNIPDISSAIPSGTLVTLIQGVAAAGAGLGAASVMGRLFGGSSQSSIAGENTSDLIISNEKLNEIPENPEWSQDTQTGQKEIIRTGKKDDRFRAARERRKRHWKIDGIAEHERLRQGLTHEQEYQEIMTERPTFMERYDRNLGGELIKVSRLGRQLEELTAEERAVYGNWMIKMQSWVSKPYS